MNHLGTACALAFGCLLAPPRSQALAQTHAQIQTQTQGTTAQPARALFHEKGCEYCHGNDLRGTERGPDLTAVGKRLNRNQIRHQIHDGGGNMPAFAEALSKPEEDELVRFLTTLKVTAPGKSPPSQ